MSYVGNTNTTQAFTPAVDYFSGDGSTVAFTLSRPVASTAQVQVVVNNVPQNPTDAFTVLSNTITFTGAPSSGTNNIYVQYTSPITQIMQPGQGTVGAVQLAAGAVGTAGIADSAVTTAKIADSAITTGKIADGAVATADIANNAVTAAKLAREGSSGQVLTSNGAGSDPSYQTISTTPTTAQVLSATAGASAGAVGAYSFLIRVGATGTLSTGSTISGSSCVYADSSGITLGGTPSGTWRVMGNSTSDGVNGRGSVYLRIS